MQIIGFHSSFTAAAAAAAAAALSLLFSSVQLPQHSISRHRCHFRSILFCQRTTHTHALAVTAYVAPVKPRFCRVEAILDAN